MAYNYQGQRCGRPIPVTWAETGWALAADLVAGNVDPRPLAAGLIARAVAALPAGLGRPRVSVDAGLSDKSVAWAAVDNGCDFVIAAKRNTAVWRHIAAIESDAWAPAIAMGGAEIAECDYAPAGWPPGTRSIVRRVRVEGDDVRADPRSRRRRGTARGGREAGEQQLDEWLCSAGTVPKHANAVRQGEPQHAISRRWLRGLVAASAGPMSASPGSSHVLLAVADGLGHRLVAASVGLPAMTVRGWLRRARLNAERVRASATTALHALDSMPPRSHLRAASWPPWSTPSGGFRPPWSASAPASSLAVGVAPPPAASSLRPDLHSPG